MNRFISNVCFIGSAFAFVVVGLGIGFNAMGQGLHSSNAAGGTCTMLCSFNHWVVSSNNSNAGYTCPKMTGPCFDGTSIVVDAILVAE